MTASSRNVARGDFRRRARSGWRAGLTPFHNRPATRTYQKAGFRFLPGTGYSVEAEMKVEL